VGRSCARGAELLIAFYLFLFITFFLLFTVPTHNSQPKPLLGHMNKVSPKQNRPRKLILMNEYNAFTQKISQI